MTTIDLTDQERLEAISVLSLWLKEHANYENYGDGFYHQFLNVRAVRNKLAGLDD